MVNKETHNWSKYTEVILSARLDQCPTIQGSGNFVKEGTERAEELEDGKRRSEVLTS